MAKEMDDSQAFLFYAEKFYSGTADMLPETVGIYIRLLSKLWNMVEGLPNDPKKLARIALVSERKFNHCWNTDMLSEKFFENSNNRLTNERFEIVRAKRLSKSIKAKESADKRWRETDANALRTDSEGNANGMHISKDKLSEVKVILKEETKVSKKIVSVYDFRILIDNAISGCEFTSKFTEQSKGYFIKWAKSENKITALKKNKTELGEYFKDQIKYLDKKYTSVEIDKVLEFSSRENYVGLIEPNDLKATIIQTTQPQSRAMRQQQRNDGGEV